MNRIQSLVVAIVIGAFLPSVGLAAEWVKIVKPLPDASTYIKVGDELRIRNTMGSGDDKVYTVDVGGTPVAVKAKDVQVVDEARAALLEENVNLKQEVARLSKELADTKMRMKILAGMVAKSQKVQKAEEPAPVVREAEKPMARRANEVSVDAQTLAADYRRSELKADVKYRKKIVEVEGVVRQVGRGLGLYVRLNGAGGFDVQCGFSDENTEELSDLKIGQSVRIQGECNRLILGTVMLDHCIIR